MNLSDLKKELDKWGIEVEPDSDEPLKPEEEVLQKFRGRPFWIFDDADHKAQRDLVGDNCCFNHIIGMPHRDGKEMPMFDYEREIYDALQNYDRLWIKKSRGLGVTEFFLRYMAWLCLRDNEMRNCQMAIVVGPNAKLGTDLLTRFRERTGLDRFFKFDTDKATVKLNGCTITAYPSNHTETLRSPEAMKFIFLDEADFFAINEWKVIVDAIQGYRAKTQPVVVMVSTPNLPGGAYDKSEKDKAFPYHRLYIMFERGMPKLKVPNEYNTTEWMPTLNLIIERHDRIKLTQMPKPEKLEFGKKLALLFCENPDEVTIYRMIDIIDAALESSFQREYCVPPEQILLGDNKQICQYVENDVVVGKDGLQSVAKTFCRPYDGELVEIKGRGMLPFKVTPEHPILVVRGVIKWITAKNTRLVQHFEPEWKRAGELIEKHRLIEGDYLLMPKIKPTLDTTGFQLTSFRFAGAGKAHIESNDGYIPLNEDTAWLIGLYVAEGSTSRTQHSNINTPTVSNITLHENEVMIRDRVKRIVAELGFSSFLIRQPPVKSVRIVISSRRLARLFDRLCGKGAMNKHIPDEILYHKDEKILKACLDGYMEGDGREQEIHQTQFTRSHHYKSKSAVTVSYVLAQQLQLAYGRLGIFASVIRDRKERDIIMCGRRIHQHNRYRIQFYDDSNSNNSNKKCSIALHGEYYYVPINAISRHRYTGDVYNVATQDNTYLISNAVVHNCGEYGYGVGNLFGQQVIDAIVKDYDLKMQDGEKILAVDPAYGNADKASKFGMVGVEQLDGVAYIRFAQQVERASQVGMVEEVIKIYQDGGYHLCLVDGSQAGIIRDLQTGVAEWGLPGIAVMPVNFREKLTEMSVVVPRRCREKRVRINPIFADLINQLRAVEVNEKGHPNKKQMTFDIGDSFLMAVNHLSDGVVLMDAL